MLLLSASLARGAFVEDHATNVLGFVKCSSSIGRVKKKLALSTTSSWQCPVSVQFKWSEQIELSAKEKCFNLCVFLSQQHEYFSFKENSYFYKLLCIFNTFKNTVCEPQSGKHKFAAR